MCSGVEHEFKTCHVVRSSVPRALLLRQNPSKRVKYGSSKVDHDYAIAKAIEGGDEVLAVGIAEKVVRAKAENFFGYVGRID